MALAGSQNSRRTSVIFNFIPLSGFADGDFVKVTPDGEVYTTQVGGRGAYVPSFGEMRGCKISLNVWQVSRETISAIETVIENQKALGLTPATLVHIEVKNFDTGEHYVCPQCWIEMEPEGSFSAQAKGREYVFRCDEYIKKPVGLA